MWFSERDRKFAELQKHYRRFIEADERVKENTKAAARQHFKVLKYRFKADQVKKKLEEMDREDQEQGRARAGGAGGEAEE